MRALFTRQSTDALRWSLLAALGLSPLSACGGSTEGGSGSGGHAALGGTGSGGTGSGGTSALGGSSQSGGRHSALAGATGTGGATTSGGASTSSGGASMGPKFPCQNPVPSASDPTGSIIECDGGWKHRARAVVCPSKLPRSEVLPPSHYPQYDECRTDADCTARANGHCEGPNSNELALPANGCFYGCTSDADCSGSLCECGDPVGTCVTSNCKSDADCATDMLCASYKAEPGCDFPAYACQTPADRCVSDADCPGGEEGAGVGQTCTIYGSAQSRTCVAPTCVIGRPFLVGDEVRSAAWMARSDWRAERAPEPELDRLDVSERETLARMWARIGCLEHASIAAFARFTLELLAFGAPRELVELTSDALRDETHHAELAFALASAYRGAPLGPDKLAVAGALDGLELRQSVRQAFVEGCIGETVAAREASAASEVASDPAVRRVLARIAKDEARHAELAFRFVQWAVRELGGGLVDELCALAEAELGQVELDCLAAGEPSPAAPALRAHGVLSLPERLELRRSTLSEVVLPVLRRLAQNTAGSAYVPKTLRSTSQISCSVA